MDSDDEESNDSSFESDDYSGEVAEHNVPRFDIQSNSNLRVAERNETDDDEIAIEQGKKLVTTYADKPAEDIDPLWFLLVFPDCFPNGQGLLVEKVSVKRWLSYLIQIDGSPFQSNVLFVMLVTRLCIMDLIWQRIFNSKLHQNCLNKPKKN